MKRNPVLFSLLLPIFILFFLMLEPGAAGSAEDASKGSSISNQTGKAAGTGSLPSAKPKPIVSSNPGPVMEPHLNRKVTPRYPELARLAHVEGTVDLVVSIDEEGNVTDIRVSQGHPFLNDMAVDAVRQWKYAPMFLNGEAVPVVATVTVIFKLDNKSTAASGKSRIDLAVAEVIMRQKAGQSVADVPFILDGKANLELRITAKTASVTSQLKSSGFEMIAWPEGTQKAIGKISVEKLENLLNIKAVQYIAPHLR